MEESTWLVLGGIGLAGFFGYKYLQGNPVTVGGTPASMVPVVASNAPSSSAQTQAAVVAATGIQPAPIAVSAAQASQTAAQASINAALAKEALTSASLPSVIDPRNAGEILQLPQSFLDKLTMGTSVGTVFGTFSLQPTGFVNISKVDFFAEQALVKAYPNMTWAQYRAAKGLSGLFGRY